MFEPYRPSGVVYSLLQRPEAYHRKVFHSGKLLPSRMGWEGDGEPRYPIKNDSNKGIFAGILGHFQGHFWAFEGILGVFSLKPIK